jgi:tRNA (cmo5U34)-methyltransferase
MLLHYCATVKPGEIMPFNDSTAAHYTNGPARLVPGLQALHRMSTLLLAERVPDDGRVLVLGAGGGMELKAFADAQPGWRFLGVDPSAPMLELALHTLGPQASRVDFVNGVIDDAPALACDGAACLLTLHFLTAGQRLHTLRGLHRRLKPRAPLVVAHHSFPQAPDERRRWLERYAAFAISSGVAKADAQRAIDAMPLRLPLLPPEQDVTLLREAGFEGIELFYAGFTFKGWVAYAAPQ